MLKGRRDDFGSHQAADVRHVSQQEGTQLLTQLWARRSATSPGAAPIPHQHPPHHRPPPSAPHLLHTPIVDEPRVGTGAGNDDAGTEETSRHLQLSVIYETCGRLGGTDRRTDGWRGKERDGQMNERAHRGTDRRTEGWMERWRQRDGRRDRWMDRWTDRGIGRGHRHRRMKGRRGWMDGQRDGWRGRWRDKGTEGWSEGWWDRQMEGWTEGQRDGRTNRRTDRGPDGWTEG